MQPTAYLSNPSVQRVKAALAAAGSKSQIVAFDDSAGSAVEAAERLDVAPGAIVKSLVFIVDGDPVMALIAGDRRCDTAALAAAIGSSGKAKQADAAAVRDATGFAIGGVAPVGHAQPLPVFIDGSLERFTTVYAAAGHPHCVFAASLAMLVRVTGGKIVTRLGKEELAT